MTDLPELIANVYEKCGWTREAIDKRVYWKHPDYRYYVWPEAVGLDDFMKDIVPVLKERGWRWNSFGEFFDDQWILTLQRKDMVHACSADTPVEACFRAAWEALIPGENP